MGWNPLSWFTSAAAGGIGELTDKVSATVAQWVPDVAAREQLTAQLLQHFNDSQQSARGFAAPGVHNTWFDALVDGINRLVRPALALWAFGVLCSWWLPPVVTPAIAPYQTLIYTVFTFYFGVRAVTEDIPRLVRNILAARE